MIIIDYSAMCHAAIMAYKGKADLNLARHAILNTIRIRRKKYQAKYGEVVLACDGWENLWRKKVFPNYKCKRPAIREESSFDFEAMYEYMAVVREEIVENFPYKVILSQQAEADDVIAQIIINNQEFGKYEQNIIISADHDFKQLQIYKNVDQWSQSTKKDIKEDYPKEYLKLHTLKGDGGDGVPNVLSDDNVFRDGVRQTTLTAGKKLILLDDIHALGEEVYKNYLRNVELIDLHKCPKEVVAEIINSFEGQDPTNNKRKVMNFLIKKKCRLLLETTGDFIQ